MRRSYLPSWYFLEESLGAAGNRQVNRSSRAPAVPSQEPGNPLSHTQDSILRLMMQKTAKYSSVGSRKNVSRDGHGGAGFAPRFRLEP